VPQLLSQHDVFLLASDYEGLPLSMVEAMGAGLVPVVSELPSGIRELVDETTGRRVAPDNVTGYAEAIIWLHEHRDAMGRMSANARTRVVREFSTSAMADRWLGAFPQATPPGIVWPSSWSIKPPLQMENLLRFSRPGRVLRRLALRLRSK
jgi:glycosyltransferase involved in cell wall biosynthesis